MEFALQYIKSGEKKMKKSVVIWSKEFMIIEVNLLQKKSFIQLNHGVFFCRQFRIFPVLNEQFH